MKLSHLLSCLSPIPTVPDREITEITEDSRKCHANALFVCVEGYRADGHIYAPRAYERGCRVFLAQKPLELPADATVIPCENTQRALGLLACRFYGDPSHRLTVIGITGTKGKTTTALMLQGILEEGGIPCGYIGTNGIRFGNRQINTANTTPDAVTLQKALSEMERAGCKAVALEVSSQAVLRHRIDGIRLSCALFTNLFPDHIGDGEHRDFADYRRCKRSILQDFGASLLVYNGDDPHAADMIRDFGGQGIACAQSNKGTYHRSESKPLFTEHGLGVGFTVFHEADQVEVRLPLIGDGNACNALMAMATARECFGIDLWRSAKTLEGLTVAGRSEVYPLGGGRIAVIDYAHNGESLRGLLAELRKFPHRRLLCLFGSVGERTALRRRDLGLAAAENADFCVLTSDNPGTEAPEAILLEIAEAFVGKSTPYVSVPDRKKAIRYAVDQMTEGDILVLAGKGHEAYQLIGDQKLPFSEREILMEAASEKSTV